MALNVLAIGGEDALMEMYASEAGRKYFPKIYKKMQAKEAPPTDEELSTTVDLIVNGFVFNCGTASQIVSRSMFYLAQDLPDDWLERYLRGVQSVTPASIQRAFLENLNPDEMTILIVGDVDRIGREALAAFGPVSELEVR